MKNKEKLTQKWAVASFFDGLPVGFEFPREDTPPHATLAGVFSIGLDGTAIAGLLRGCTKDLNAFKIEGDIIEQWGDDLRVTTILSSDEFDTLYRVIQKTLIDHTAIFNEPQYLGDGFRPHVTLQKHRFLKPGSIETIRNVSLVDMFPHGDGYRRRIHATLELKDA